MATQTDLRLLNETLFESLSTPGMEKQAVDAINDYTRTKIREDGFYRRILPMLEITNDELDPQIDTDKPVKIIEREPDSPPAMTLPFGTLPTNFYIHGPKYRVTFTRLMTQKAQKDVDELRTYTMDIRQVLSDNQMKDLQAHEDKAFVDSVNRAMVGPDIPVPHNGNAVQWETIQGGISRAGVADAKKIMPRGPGRFEAQLAMINNITSKELEKIGREEMGGDMSQDIVKDGWAESHWMGLDWVITIKHALVPDDTMFMFADPKFIGKSFSLEDVTMHVKREAFMIEFFTYETLGGAIGNVGGLARADFR